MSNIQSLWHPVCTSDDNQVESRRTIESDLVDPTPRWSVNGIRSPFSHSHYHIPYPSYLSLPSRVCNDTDTGISLPTPILGVARFIDASIYRDTFPAIRIAILFFTITIFFFFFFSTMIFIWGEKRHNNIYMRFLQSNSSNT